VINESDGAKPLESSAPLPSGAVLVRQRFPSVPDAPVVATLTITQDKVWNGVLASPLPCEGVPPTPAGASPTPEPSLSAENLANAAWVRTR